MAIEKGASFENLSTAVNKIKQDFAKKTDVTSAINTKLSSTYKAGGSVAFADLPELTEANLGLVVNVTDEFVTTTDFVEGAGQKHPAGTNVAVVLVGEEYKYDVMAGFVDLSGMAEKEQVASDISTAKSDAIDQANADTDEKLEDYVKVADIEYATEAEVLALFEDSEET